MRFFSSFLASCLLGSACAPAQQVPQAKQPERVTGSAQAGTQTAPPAPSTQTVPPRAAAGSLLELALHVLHEAHPDWQLSVLGQNDIAVRSAGKTLELSLDNIERDSSSDRGLAEPLIRTAMHKLEQLFVTDEKEPYASVEARLRPVLVPRDYAERYGLATRDFVSNVQEALVVDDPTTMHYVLSTDLSRWHVTFDAAEAMARSGLWQASQAVKVAAISPGDPSVKGKMVTLTVGDGYDAARLALPQMRAALGAALGYPFYVGIPNRDFLVAWSSDASFASNFATNIQSDYAKQGHPLSPEVYLVDQKGVHPAH